MFEKKPLQMSIDEHQDMLIDKGYKIIGGGGFGTIFATPSSKHVIRVAQKMSNEEVDRWFNYALEVMDKDNPFFSKNQIYHIIRQL